MKTRELAKKIRMLVCDLDGVFTDGGLYYDEEGKISKRFHVQDGFGIKLAQSANLQVAVLTGLESESARLRIKELGIKEYHAGNSEKEIILTEISSRNNIGNLVFEKFEEMAFVGDDWIDAACMSRVGLPVAVANAQPEIQDLAVLSTRAPGGSGAVREVINFILNAQNQLNPFWEKWKHSQNSL